MTSIQINKIVSVWNIKNSYLLKVYESIHDTNNKNAIEQFLHVCLFRVVFKIAGVISKGFSLADS